jgi:hypothetical protein
MRLALSQKTSMNESKNKADGDQLAEIITLREKGMYILTNIIKQGDQDCN